ncbi:MAG: hypothetical protein K6F32_01635, partial [Bacilli bacterium]|nr:hypothetical protein [Bacilli bacterium]
FPEDKLIFDVGHQCYAHKLLTGRSLDHLNEGGYCAGFQKICESPYDPYEAGHSSTSISAAEAFAIARDLKQEKFDIVAVIGDSSVVNGLSFEALNDLAARNHKVIIVLNDNDMSISRPTGAIGRFFRKISTGKGYNKIKKGFRRLIYRGPVGKAVYNFTYGLKSSIKRKLVPLTMFDNMGFTYMGPYDGHNLKVLEKNLKRAKNASKPVIFHVTTIKGKGYRPAENDRTGYWHGVTPFNIEDGTPKKQHPGFISWSHYFADLTKSYMDANDKAFLVTPATLKGSGLEDSFKAHPERCMDVGIAEEHATTLCGALALEGFHPILSIYSTFLQRSYDELSHDCARMKIDMTLLIDRAGMVGKNGDTHQGIYDAAYLKSIPGVTLTMPSTKAIAHTLYEQSFGHHGVFGIRFSREMVAIDEDDSLLDLEYGKFLPIHKGSGKTALLTVGPLGRKLADLAVEAGLDVDVIDPVYLVPVNQDEIRKLLDYQHVFVYDPYSTIEGFSREVAAILMELGYHGKVTLKAIGNEFVPQDSLAKQLDQFGLAPETVLEDLKAIA